MSQKTDETDTPTAENKIKMSLSDNYDNQTSIAQFVKFDTLRSNMVYYLLDESGVKSIVTDQTTTLNTRMVELDKSKKYELFVVFRGVECDGLDKIVVGSSRADLINVALNDKSAPTPRSIVLSASTHIAPGGANIGLALSRACSRVDLNLSGVSVHNVALNGVQTFSYLFANQHKEAKSVAKDFKINMETPATESVRGLTYLFEQSTKDLSFVFDCAVAGQSERQQVVVNVPYDSIKRNNIYSISLSADNINPDDPGAIDPPVINRKITAKFEILPWNSEDVEVGYPELKDNIVINSSQFIVDPNNVKFDAEKRLINVSYHGAEVVIPFTGSCDKLVSLENATDNVALATVSNTKYKNEKVILTVKQAADSPAYSFKINVQNALSTDRVTTYTVNVDRSSYPSVVMGNIEWLTFNSGSGKDHPRLELGQTVRDLYKSNWADFVYMCQWGERPNPTIFLAPSVENAKPGQDPAGKLLNQAAGLTWVNKLPCPSGWRLPTIAELWRIWPTNGWGVNSSNVTTYTVSGVTYTAQVQESEAIYKYSGANQPTRLLVIKQGGNELLFPLAGYRIRDDYNSGAKTPVEVGVSGFYWSDVIGNQTYNARVKGLNNGSSWNGDGTNKFELYGSWNMVRCVRNLK